MNRLFTGNIERQRSSAQHSAIRGKCSTDNFITALQQVSD
jgi:hypothetical protein